MEKFYSDNNNKKDFFIVFVMILTLISGTVLYSIFAIDIDDEFDDGVDYDMNAENNKDIPFDEVSELNNIVEEGPLDGNKTKNNTSSGEDEFIFVINRKIIFKNSESFGNVKIENPITNKYNFYVTMKLKDGDDDDIIYKSPVLEPNHHIKNDYLIKKLSKGLHKAEATIVVIDPETEEELAQNQVEIEIQIKK